MTRHAGTRTGLVLVWVIGLAAGALSVALVLETAGRGPNRWNLAG